MKKPLIFAFVFALFLGVFSFPTNSFALTVYQQLSDSSGFVNIFDAPATPYNNHFLFGSFVSSSNFDSFPGTMQITYRQNSGASFSSTLSFIDLFTNSSCSGFPIQGYTFLPSGSIGDDQFLLGSSSVPYDFISGQTYWICGTGIGIDADVITNLSSDFIYGYITDSGGNSVPIAPGIPGFTDVGISTTSQQVYCNANFSTSSGLLTSIGQSISLGFCNVGVFLFIPSQQALSNFQSLSTTSQQRIPFSYFYQFKNAINGLVATTSSTAVPVYSSNLAAIGIGSTSPIGNILPNLDWLSKATIDTYLPSGIHDALFLLARSVIWVIVLLMMYRRIVPHKVNI